MKKYFWDIIRYKYVDFSGRASRKEFWFFNLWYALISLITGVMFMAALTAENPSGAAIIITGLIVIIVGFGMFLPLLALTVRRLHDAGLTGWLVLLLLIVPVINIIFGFLPPTEGENQFGPRP